MREYLKRDKEVTAAIGNKKGTVLLVLKLSYLKRVQRFYTVQSAHTSLHVEQSKEMGHIGKKSSPLYFEANNLVTITIPFIWKIQIDKSVRPRTIKMANFVLQVPNSLRSFTVSASASSNGETNLMGQLYLVVFCDKDEIFDQNFVFQGLLL